MVAITICQIYYQMIIGSISFFINVWYLNYVLIESGWYFEHGEHCKMVKGKSSSKINNNEYLFFEVGSKWITISFNLKWNWPTLLLIQKCIHIGTHRLWLRTIVVQKSFTYEGLYF